LLAPIHAAPACASHSLIVGEYRKRRRSVAKNPAAEADVFLCIAIAVLLDEL